MSKLQQSHYADSHAGILLLPLYALEKNTVNWGFGNQDVEFHLSESKTSSTKDSDCVLKPLGSRGRTHAQAFRKPRQPHIVLLLILPVRCETETVVLLIQRKSKLPTCADLEGCSPPEIILFSQLFLLLSLMLG